MARSNSHALSQSRSQTTSRSQSQAKSLHLTRCWAANSFSISSLCLVMIIMFVSHSSSRAHALSLIAAPIVGPDSELNSVALAAKTWKMCKVIMRWRKVPSIRFEWADIVEIKVAVRVVVLAHVVVIIWLLCKGWEVWNDLEFRAEPRCWDEGGRKRDKKKSLGGN